MNIIYKRLYQRTFWLKKAEEYGIPTEGREEKAWREAQNQYQRAYRAAKKTEGGLIS